MLQCHAFYSSTACRMKIFLKLMSTQVVLKPKSKFRDGESMWCLVPRHFNYIKGEIPLYVPFISPLFAAIPPGQQWDSWMKGTGPEPG